MWFRIELNKDNSIASCEATSGSRNEGRAVHYVEAESKGSAIALLLSRYASNNEARRKAARTRADALRAEGLCRRCGRNKCSLGLTTCTDCLAKRNARHAERAAGAPILDQRATSVNQKLAAQARRQQYDVSKAMRKAAGYLIMVRVAYARCLKSFDEMTPAVYRTWLAEALRLASEKEQASAQHRAKQQDAKGRKRAK